MSATQLLKLAFILFCLFPSVSSAEQVKLVGNKLFIAAKRAVQARFTIDYASPRCDERKRGIRSSTVCVYYHDADNYFRYGKTEEISLGSFASGSVARILFIGSTQGDDYHNFTNIPDAAYGRGGDDNLRSEADYARLNGGAGDDSLTAAGDHVTLKGGNGKDRLVATGFSCNVFAGVDNDSDLIETKTWYDQPAYVDTIHQANTTHQVADYRDIVRRDSQDIILR